MPPTKASQALMDEPFKNVKGQTEDLPSEFPCSIKKANLSVAELLEDLQGRSGSYVETASLVCFLWCYFMIWGSQTKNSLPLNIVNFIAVTSTHQN